MRMQRYRTTGCGMRTARGGEPPWAMRAPPAAKPHEGVRTATRHGGTSGEPPRAMRGRTGRRASLACVIMVRSRGRTAGGVVPDAARCAAIGGARRRPRKTLSVCYFAKLRTAVATGRGDWCAAVTGRTQRDTWDRGEADREKRKRPAVAGLFRWMGCLNRGVISLDRRRIRRDDWRSRRIRCVRGLRGVLHRS